MELNEAIDNINLLITNLENMSIKEIEPENYILLNSLNTVLEELNNRISKEEMQNILDAVKLKREKEIEEMVISLRGSAVDILENIIREKWNKE